MITESYNRYGLHAGITTLSSAAFNVHESIHASPLSIFSRMVASSAAWKERPVVSAQRYTPSVVGDNMTLTAGASAVNRSQSAVCNLTSAIPPLVGFHNVKAIVNIARSTAITNATHAGQPPMSQKLAGTAPPTLPPM